MRMKLDLLHLAKQRGWQPEDPLALAIVAKHLSEGKPVHIVQEAGAKDWHSALPETVTLYQQMPTHPDPQIAVLVISDRSGRPRPEVDRLAVVRPPTLTLGVACRREVTSDDLEEALRQLCRREGYSALSLSAVAASARRQRLAALEELAERRRVPLLLYPDLVLGRTPLGAPGKIAGTCAVSAILAAGVTQPIVNSVPFFGKLTLALARRPQ